MWQLFVVGTVPLHSLRKTGLGLTYVLAQILLDLFGSQLIWFSHHLTLADWRLLRAKFRCWQTWVPTARYDTTHTNAWRRHKRSVRTACFRFLGALPQIIRGRFSCWKVCREKWERGIEMLQSELSDWSTSLSATFPPLAAEQKEGASGREGWAQTRTGCMKTSVRAAGVSVLLPATRKILGNTLVRACRFAIIQFLSNSRVSQEFGANLLPTVD